MYSYRKRKKLVINKKPLLIIIFIASIFLGIGYAQVSDVDLHITGDAVAYAEEEVLITSVVLDSSNYANPSDSIIRDTYLTLLHSTIDLGNNLDSSITYRVNIWNNSGIDVTYNDAVYEVGTGYDNTDIEFVVGGISHGDVLTAGSHITITITFKYLDNLSTITNDTLNSYINFEFNAEEKTARIGNVYYDSLQEAVQAVPTDNTETNVVLLKDTSELVRIEQNQNVNFDLQNFTLSNDGNDRVIYNFGTVKISNGIITSDAATNGAVNNEEGATMIISGGSIIVTGGRQAFYNNKGTATITGNAYLRNTTSERASVQNVAGGTLTITGGTIVSNASNGITNDGTLILGSKDGNVSVSSPSIQGYKYGIGKDKNNNGTVKFYDGIIKSRLATFIDITRVTDIETGYGIASSTEVIGGTTYNTAYLDIDYKLVTFKPNGGSVSETGRYVQVGHAVGTLPTPTRNGYTFDGWYTAASGGTLIDSSTIINNAITFYAHWTKIPDVVQVGQTMYSTITEALAAVPDNTQTTVLLLKNTNEWVTVPATKNIILDLNGLTIGSTNDKPIIENSGTLYITNGTMNSTATQSIINNLAGSLTIDGVTMSINTNKQAMYITGGSVLITGGSTLSSLTNGTPSGGNMTRGTVHNVSGTLTIDDATIIGVNQQAISNESGATTTIGIKDGSIATTIPSIRGETYGIVSTGTLNIYDGKIMGINGAIDGTVTDIETGSQFVDSSEVIDNKTYYSKHLEIP